jgi:hypothetical protein
MYVVYGNLLCTRFGSFRVINFNLFFPDHLADFLFLSLEDPTIIPGFCSRTPDPKHRRSLYLPNQDFDCVSENMVGVDAEFDDRHETTIYNRPSLSLSLSLSLRLLASSTLGHMLS